MYIQLLTFFLVILNQYSLYHSYQVKLNNKRFTYNNLISLHSSMVSNEISPETSSLDKPINRRRELLKDASNVRLKTKKRLTWEERYEFDPLRSDSPTVDVHTPLDSFTKWFVCIGTIDSNEMLEKRQEAWIHHMQWARRSVLLQNILNVKDKVSLNKIEPSVDENQDSISDILNHYDIIPNIKVESDYTLLSEDCLRPKTQVLICRGNSSEDVFSYLAKEPLQAHGGVAPWKLYEIVLEKDSIDDEDNDLSHILTADIHDPYMFLAFNRDIKKNIPQISKVLDNSVQYHIEAATAPVTSQVIDDKNTISYLGTYANSSRIALLGRLFHINPPCVLVNNKQQKQSKKDNDQEAAGQILLFNARSRADALRYLARDPIAAATTSTSATSSPVVTVISTEDTPTKKTKSTKTTKKDSKKTAASFLFDEMMLCSANIQDVSGLHHMMGRTFGEKTQLDMIHYMDPEDLLQQGLNHGLLPIDTLSQHFQENVLTLELLANHSLSFRYNRLSLQDIYNSSGLLRSAGPAGFVTLDSSMAALTSLGRGNTAIGTKSVDQLFQGWNKVMSKFQKTRLRPNVVAAMEAVVASNTLTKSNNNNNKATAINTNPSSYSDSYHFSSLEDIDEDDDMNELTTSFEKKKTKTRITKKKAIDIDVNDDSNIDNDEGDIEEEEGGIDMLDDDMTNEEDFAANDELFDIM